jgi:hypothetical protein
MKYFRHFFQVDGEVVVLMTDQQMVELGLTALGDRWKLRDFCSDSTIIQQQLFFPSRSSTASASASTSSSSSKIFSEDPEKRKILLLHLRQQYSGSRVKKKVGRQPRAERVIQLGLRVDVGVEVGQDGISVRKHKTIKAPLGDKNTIALKFDIDVSYTDMLHMVKQAFFPGGVSPVLGDGTNFSTFELVNGRNINISDGPTIFTINGYIQDHMIPGSVRLYLMCIPHASISGEGDHCDDDMGSDSEYLPELACLQPSAANFTATSPSNEVYIRNDLLSRPQNTGPTTSASSSATSSGYMFYQRQV